MHKPTFWQVTVGHCNDLGIVLLVLLILILSTWRKRKGILMLIISTKNDSNFENEPNFPFHECVNYR